MADRIYLSYGAAGLYKRTRGEELAANDWFVVEGGKNIVGEPIPIRRAVASLLRAGRLVWALDPSGGHLVAVTEDDLDAIEDAAP